MKIIFMGTPEFSCPALKNLISDPEFDIVAVYTREPQIAGRGHKVTNSPVHKLALEHDLKVITPKTLRNLEAQNELINLQADAIAVVAYGLMLPKEVLEATKFGCLNIHPSLLPRWRGAAPIQRTIMAGDNETGIAIMQMDEGLDSGDVLCQEKFNLDGKENYESLSIKLSTMGAKILRETLKKVRDRKIAAVKQDDEFTTYAKKILKDECEIDWNLSAQEINRKIRGLSGSLGAYFYQNAEKIKIHAAEVVDSDEFDSIKAGKIINNNLEIKCGEGIIRPLRLQRPGKRKMLIEEFLLGFKIG